MNFRREEPILGAENEPGRHRRPRVQRPRSMTRSVRLVARVAASLLNAAGLPELVTNSLAEYEDAAVALAQDRRRLTSYARRFAEEASQ